MPARVEATPAAPIDLSVEGGEERWRSTPSFTLRWTNPAGTIAAVHYRLLRPDGSVATAERTIGWDATEIDSLSVPSLPGAYKAEVWLEDDTGSQGPAATATLRFDNGRPGAVAAEQPAGWIGRTAFPYAIRISHPADPQPLSGIRGYALSIDGLPNGEPCAGEPCEEGEIDLHAGIDGDSLVVAELPAGVDYVHAVAVSGSGMPSVGVGTTLLRVDKTDPETALSGIPDGWSSRPVTLTASAADADSGMEALSGSPQPFTAIRVDGGAPTVAAGDRVSAAVISSGVHTVAYYARDAAGNVDDGGSSNGHANRMPATAVVRIDREPPAVAFAGAQDPADPELIEARVADAGSGLDADRASIAVRRVGGGERFARLPTVLSTGVLRARWNSAAYPPGEYEFEATAYDRAGNAASSDRRSSGAEMRLPAPLKLPVRILSQRGRRPVRYGCGAWFSGRLLTGRRTPLAGMPVRIIERFAAGAAPGERISTVRSDSDGRFDLRLRPGPSRRIFAEVAPSARTQAATSDPLDLEVRSRLALRVSAARARVGGRAIVFRGTVASEGATIPAEGKTVELQFRLAGLPWSEFRALRSDRHGHFRFAYRFSDDDSRGVRFQFRAYAPAQAGWPFEPAGSSPVTVLGT
jgi:hypothetical protein